MDSATLFSSDRGRLPYLPVETSSFQVDVAQESLSDSYQIIPITGIADTQRRPKPALGKSLSIDNGSKILIFFLKPQGPKLMLSRNHCVIPVHIFIL